MAMRHRFFLLALLVAACAIQPAAHAGEWPYRADFVGLTFDQMVLKYGKPSRSTTLSDGITRLLEYQTHTGLIYKDKTRELSSCRVRLLMKHDRVVDADAVGDWKSCDTLMETRERNHYSDFRNHF